MSPDFTHLKAAVLDMDGVTWRGSEILPGVPDFFDFLQANDIPYVLATNNSTRTVDSYVEKLNGLGIPAGPEQVVTSAVATSEYVVQHYDPAETPVYIIGQEGIRRGLAEKGFREDPDAARLVVLGMDFSVNYEKFRIATLRIRAGADFIGTNGDITFPTPEGLVPGSGSLLALLSAATDVQPLVIGKPEPAMFEVALQRLGVRPAEAVMIGDRLETDILGANQAGLHSVVVLSGVTTAETARVSAIKAGAVFENLAAVQQAWEASLARVR